MTIGDAIDSLMEGGLGEVLAELEAMRQGDQQLSRKIALGIGAVWLVFAAFMRVKECNWFAVAVTGFIAIAIWLLLRNRFASDMASHFRKLVMPYLVTKNCPDLTYCADYSISQDEFEASGLFTMPDRFWGKDYVAGTVGETEIRFSMVHAQERREETITETHTDSDGHTHTTTRTEERWYDIFKGLLFSADFNKDTFGYTSVRCGKTGFFDRMSKWNVKLEDPTFEERFTVTTNDQVEARYILTPAMMERITAMADDMGYSFSMSFTGSRLYMALHVDYDAFEPSMKKPCMDRQQLAHMFWVLYKVIGIVDALDLDTRIWGKQASG